MRGRVVIPIHDPHGKPVAYAGRSLDESPPKCRLPAGFVKSRVLFNFHRAAAWGQETVVVVEGYFDSLKVHQAGFPFVVALMGTVLPEVPQGLILKQFRRIILMLDGDDSGSAGGREDRRTTGAPMLRSRRRSACRQPAGSTGAGRDLCATERES